MSKKGQAKPLWSRVARARDKFNAKVDHYVRLHEKAAEKAAEKGDDGPIRWALEHIAVLDDSGAEIRPLAPSIDRKVVEQGTNGPTINIGFALPGLPTHSALESQQSCGLPPVAHSTTVIDVTPTRQLLDPAIDAIVKSESTKLEPQDVGAKVEVVESRRNLEDCPTIEAESDNSHNDNHA